MKQHKPPTRLVTALGGLLLCWLLVSAAGCPGQPDTTPKPVKVTQTPDQATDKAKPKTEPASNKDGITDHEPEPGSKSVMDVGPSAPSMFIISGLNGYTEPCGCTLDVLLGGIDRIAGFLGEAKTKAKGSLVVDAGNTLFDMPELETHRIPQEKAKVDVIIQGLTQMDIASTTPGPNDFALGKHFYLDRVRGAGLPILVSNLKEEGGLPLGEPYKIHDLEGFKVGMVGLVQPDLFTGLEGLQVSDPVPDAKAAVKALKKEGAQVIVAVVHGDLKSSKLLLSEVPDINFIIVGHKPRNTDQTDEVEGSYTMEAYDQGRYVGVLKLFAGPNKDKAPKTWANAKSVSKADVDRVQRRITQLEDQIGRMPPATPGKEPAFHKRLLTQLEELKAEREKIKNASIDIPTDKASFLYRSIAMEPGYLLDKGLTQAREDYNKKLKSLIEANPEPIEPVADGLAEYVGSDRCATCHVDAAKVWKTTAHSRAMATLVKRDKAFGKNCVGCHVTGYRKPGGSVAGKLQYTATIGAETFTKKLENVGCEVCHGPGSLHIQTPVGKDGKAQNIKRQVPESLCIKCHNEEHSARFNHSTYLPQILGKGHGTK